MRSGALFAGIGGFCSGFGKAGLPTAWAVENDASATLTYARNFPDSRLIQRDVRTVSVRTDKLEPVDVLHAGFPCQSFSQAGERQGFSDPRGKLFFEVIRLVKEFGSDKPKVLVLENAPFLRYGEGGAWFLEMQNAIRRAGYWFREHNCAELNAFRITNLPQQRIRLFMVAFCTDAFTNGRFGFPDEEHNAPKDLSKFIDFDAEVAPEYYLPKENRYNLLIRKAVTDRSCIYQLRKYQVRAKEPGVCPTLTANMGQGGHNVPFVMTERGLRKLTEQECLRLQGFPRSFKFPATVPRAHRYTQIGNSVAPPVAQLVAKRVKEKLLEAQTNENRLRISA